jgi:CelD/BcsL family acetyltransferase involved in cellulose biosynthesis
MTIDVLRACELTPEIVSAWRSFQAADPDLGSPFLTPDWAQAVERAQGERRVRVAVVRDGGRPAAVLAVRPRRSTAQPVGAPMSDYQAVLSAPDASVDIQAVLKALGVGRYDFTHVPLSQRAFSAGVRGLQTSWCVDVAAGWPAYVEDLRRRKSALIKDSGNRTRRLEREVGEVVFTPDNREPVDFERLIALQRAQFRQTRQTDIFDRPWTLRLLNDLFRTRQQNFGGMLSTLHVGGKLASGHFGLYAEGVLHSWFLVYDSNYGKHSPGLLLMTGLVQHLAESGHWREFDLGPGDYPYKQRLANRGREIGYGFVGRPSPAAVFRGAVYWVRGQAEAAPLGRFSALPGKAMRRWDLIRALG